MPPLTREGVIPMRRTPIADRMVAFTAVFKPHQLETIERVADENGWSTAAALREMVEWYIDFSKREAA